MFVKQIRRNVSLKLMSTNNFINIWLITIRNSFFLLKLEHSHWSATQVIKTRIFQIDQLNNCSFSKVDKTSFFK